MNKTFADVRVIDKLYWSAIGMDHISETIVTDTHLNLDGVHLPRTCDVTFKTNDGFTFDICHCVMPLHNCIVFTHQDNEIYIGTTKEVVATQILKTLDSKIKFWTDRKERFIGNL